MVQAVDFPLVSDRAGKLSRALRAYNHDDGTSARAGFLIDTDGTIAACEFHHEAIGRNAGELLRRLDAAVAVKKAGGGGLSCRIEAR